VVPILNWLEVNNEKQQLPSMPMTFVFQLEGIMKFLSRLGKMIHYLGLSNRLRQFNAELLEQLQQHERLTDYRTVNLARKSEQSKSSNDKRELAVDSLYLNQYCIDKVAIGIFHVGADRQIKYVNECGAAMLGYSPDELSTMSITDFDSIFNPKVWQELHERGLNDHFYKFVSTHRRKDGTEYPVELTVNCLIHAGKVLLVFFAQDISERIRVELEFQAALREKDILLQEVHHRMRNNLQVVSDLLGLQSDFIKDKQTRKFFQESQDRIWSMTFIHEMLTLARDFVNIDLADYLKNLTEYLFRSYVTDFERISYTVESDEITVGTVEAIPCGLIVNELFSNSLKHAFPDGRQGEIAVRCCSEEDGRLILTVSDTGVGIPPGLDFRNTESLGLQLVNLLVNQLQGEIEIENAVGDPFRSSFRSHNPQ